MNDNYNHCQYPFHLGIYQQGQIWHYLIGIELLNAFSPLDNNYPGVKNPPKEEDLLLTNSNWVGIHKGMVKREQQRQVGLCALTLDRLLTVVVELSSCPCSAMR